MAHARFATHDVLQNNSFPSSQTFSSKSERDPISPYSSWIFPNSARYLPELYPSNRYDKFFDRCQKSLFIHMERASDYFRHVQLLCCRVHLLSHIQIILRHRTLKICGYVENSTHIHRQITTVDNSQFACNRPDLTKITICKKVPSLTGRDLSGKASTQRFSC